MAVIEYLSAGGSDLPSALLAEGLAMRDAVVADLAAVCRVGVAVDAAGRSAWRAPVPDGAGAETNPLVRAARSTARVVPVAAGVGETPARFAARLAATHDAVWAVAPETGGALAALCAAVPASRWLGCSPAAIRLAGSKRATLAQLQAAGVRTPLDFVDAGAHGPHDLHDLREAAAPRHWVVKPDDGVGAEHTRRHAHAAAAASDLDARARGGRPSVCEPWVDGEAMSLTVLCTAQACTLASVNRQRIEVDGGGTVHARGLAIDVLRRGDPRWPALAGTAGAVHAAIPGLRGCIGIDLVWHAVRGPVVIEVNPRTTSAYVGLSRALGRNVAAEVLAAFRRDAPAPVSAALSTPTPTTTSAPTPTAPRRATKTGTGTGTGTGRAA